MKIENGKNLLIGLPEFSRAQEIELPFEYGWFVQHKIIIYGLKSIDALYIRRNYQSLGLLCKVEREVGRLIIFQKQTTLSCRDLAVLYILPGFKEQEYLRDCSF